MVRPVTSTFTAHFTQSYRADGSRKASLRAKEPVYRVDLAAAQFNGGGHACAAGLNLKTNTENFHARLVAVLAQRIAAADAERAR
jgi:phosphoesterase RecJ-like protein